MENQMNLDEYLDKKYLTFYLDEKGKVLSTFKKGINEKKKDAFIEGFFMAKKMYDKEK